MSRIAIFGNFVVDIIGKPIERLPEAGRLLLIDALETHVGGNGPNTAGALARLGGEVAAVGRVGYDLYGRFVLDELRSCGVDTTTVIEDPEASTGVTLVAVDPTGERSFLHHYGANARLTPDDVAWDRIPGAGHLHLGGFFVLPAIDGDAAAKIFRTARERGMTTSLDVCWDQSGRWMAALQPCLPFVDVAVPSEDEARCLTGREEPREMAAALRESGCKEVVIKLGERGCHYAGSEGTLTVPAFDVEARDATGAGDCFIAGLLYARSHAWDLERTLRFANACGARSVERLGAVSGMAPADEIEAWAGTQRRRE